MQRATGNLPFLFADKLVSSNPVFGKSGLLNGVRIIHKSQFQRFIEKLGFHETESRQKIELDEGDCIRTPLYIFIWFCFFQMLK